MSHRSRGDVKCCRGVVAACDEDDCETATTATSNNTRTNGGFSSSATTITSSLSGTAGTLANTILLTRRRRRTSIEYVEENHDKGGGGGGRLSITGLRERQEFLDRNANLENAVQVLTEENEELLVDVQDLLDEESHLSKELEQQERTIQMLRNENKHLQKERDDLADEVEQFHREGNVKEILELMSDTQHQLRQKEKQFMLNQRVWEDTIDMCHKEKSDLEEKLHQTHHMKTQREKILSKVQKKLHSYTSAVTNLIEDEVALHDVVAKYSSMKNELEQSPHKQQNASCDDNNSNIRSDHYKKKKKESQQHNKVFPSSIRDYVTQASLNQIHQLEDLKFSLESMEDKIRETCSSKGNSKTDAAEAKNAYPQNHCHSSKDNHYCSTTRAVSTNEDAQAEKLMQNLSRRGKRLLLKTETMNYHNNSISKLQHPTSTITNDSSMKSFEDGCCGGDDESSIFSATSSAASSAASAIFRTVGEHVSSKQMLKTIAKGGKWFLHDANTNASENDDKTTLSAATGHQSVASDGSNMSQNIDRRQHLALLSEYRKKERQNHQQQQQSLFQINSCSSSVGGHDSVSSMGSTLQELEQELKEDLNAELMQQHTMASSMRKIDVIETLFSRSKSGRKV